MAKELETRKCILSGETKPKSELLRFVVLEKGRLVPDFDKKLSGKGIYLSNSKHVIETVVNSPKINKIFHKQVKAELNLPDIIEKILADKGLSALNLARKSGNLVLGFEKIKEQIIKDKVAFVIEATDAGSDGKKKMSELGAKIEILSIYNSAAFEKAFNREMVVYLAVLKSEVSAMVYENIKRYKDYLNG